MRLQAIEDPRRPTRPPPAIAVLELGFRPFYLLAGLWAIVAMQFWLAELHGHVWRSDSLPGMFWHGHEMIFGFAAATVAGFTLTAVRNWTQRQTARHGWLAALVLLWLAGRLVFLSRPAAGALDLAFLPAVALAIGINIVRARQWRNLFLPLLLLLLAGCNLGFHLGAAGGDAVAMTISLRAALFILVMLEIAIAGRVIPGFTANALATAAPLRNAGLDRFAIAAAAAAFVLACTPVPAAIAAAVAAVAGAAHLARLSGWKPWRVTGSPMLWVLHAAYAWIGIGLLLLAAAQMEWIAITAAIHAFAVGATGGLIIGMMTRTARGHTARPVKAGRLEVSAYVLVGAAAVVRVGIAVVPGLPYLAGLDLAGSLWCAGFLLFVLRFAAWLIRPRADGLPG
jgi:uncharacterized protein involved in response to NO